MVSEPKGDRSKCNKFSCDHDRVSRFKSHLWQWSQNATNIAKAYQPIKRRNIEDCCLETSYPKSAQVFKILKEIWKTFIAQIWQRLWPPRDSLQRFRGSSRSVQILRGLSLTAPWDTSLRSPLGQVPSPVPMGRMSPCPWPGPGRLPCWAVFSHISFQWSFVTPFFPRE